MPPSKRNFYPSRSNNDHHQQTTHQSSLLPSSSSPISIRATPLLELIASKCDPSHQSPDVINKPFFGTVLRSSIDRNIHKMIQVSNENPADVSYSLVTDAVNAGWCALGGSASHPNVRLTASGVKQLTASTSRYDLISFAAQFIAKQQQQQQQERETPKQSRNDNAMMMLVPKPKSKNEQNKIQQQQQQQITNNDDDDDDIVLGYDPNGIIDDNDDAVAVAVPSKPSSPANNSILSLPNPKSSLIRTKKDGRHTQEQQQPKPTHHQRKSSAEEQREKQLLEEQERERKMEEEAERKRQVAENAKKKEEEKKSHKQQQATLEQKTKLEKKLRGSVKAGNYDAAISFCNEIFALEGRKFTNLLSRDQLKQLADNISSAVTEDDELHSNTNLETLCKATAVYSMAINKCDTSSDEDCNSILSELLCGRSWCNNELGNFNLARQDAEQVCEMYPEWSEGFLRKGLACAGENDIAEAYKSFTKCLELKKGVDDDDIEFVDEKIVELRGKLNEKQTCEERQQQEKARKANKDHSEAEKLRVPEFTPEDTGTLGGVFERMRSWCVDRICELGTVYERGDDDDEALATAQAANPEQLFNEGAYLLKQRKVISTQTAVSFFTRVLEQQSLSSNNNDFTVRALLKRSECYSFLKKFKESLSDLARCLEIDSTDVDRKDILQRQYTVAWKCKDWTCALKACEEYLELDPSDTQMRARLRTAENLCPIRQKKLREEQSASVREMIKRNNDENDRITAMKEEKTQELLRHKAGSCYEHDDDNDDTTVKNNTNNTIIHRPAAHHSCSCDCDIVRNQRRCCVCMDERPLQAEFTYQAYVDGRGYLNNVPRWKYYCEKCRITCEQEYRQEMLLRRSAREQDNDDSIRQEKRRKEEAKKAHQRLRDIQRRDDRINEEEQRQDRQRIERFPLQVQFDQCVQEVLRQAPYRVQKHFQEHSHPYASVGYRNERERIQNQKAAREEIRRLDSSEYYGPGGMWRDKLERVFLVHICETGRGYEHTGGTTPSSSLTSILRNNTKEKGTSFASTSSPLIIYNPKTVSSVEWERCGTTVTLHVRTNYK